MNELRRTVTQEELDAAYAELPKAPAAAANGVASYEISLPDTFPSADEVDAVGIHVGKDRSNLVMFAEGKGVLSHVGLNSGYENREALYEEIAGNLAKVRKRKLTVVGSATGSVAGTLLTALPKMARAMMVKAVKLQFKTQLNTEPDELHLVPVNGAQKVTEGNSLYLAATAEKSLVEGVAKHLRKRKVRLSAWDSDLLCFARAGGYLWERHGLPLSTRFLVIFDWDHCHLLITGTDGKMLAPRLPVGIQSFLQHMLSAREAIMPKSGAEREWRVLPSDPIELRERKLLVHQAIHDVYVPLAQQIKTELYAACNQHGVSLPTHFAVVTPEPNLFHITENLAHDLSLQSIPVEKYFPVEAFGAVGAALWDRPQPKLNLMPKGQGEWLKSIKEQWAALAAKIAPAGLNVGLEGLPVGMGGILAGAAVVLALMCSLPIYKRWQVENKVETLRAEIKRVEEEKKKIALNRLREETVEKKHALVKQIELKRLSMGKAIKELFSVLPNTVKLQSLAFKSKVLTLKGQAKDPAAVEAFLKSSFNLRYLVDPTPVSIKRAKAGAEFELTFRFRG